MKHLTWELHELASNKTSKGELAQRVGIADVWKRRGTFYFQATHWGVMGRELLEKVSGMTLGIGKGEANLNKCFTGVTTRKEDWKQVSCNTQR